MARVTELVFRANNRSVVKAFSEISAGSDKTARQVSRDSKTSAGSMEKMGQSAHRVRSAVAGLAGTVGVAGLAFGIRDVVSAGMKWQTQQAQLQGALRNTGQAGGGAMADLTDAAERLARHGGFAAPENIHALTQLVTTTRSSTRAISDMTLATDISRRTGKDYSMTVRALMMLENGRTTGLARLGIAVPKVTTAVDALRASNVKATPAMLANAKAQDALASKQQAFATLTQRYSGATDRFSRTTQGRLSNMKNAWEALQASIGSGFLPVVNRVVSVAAVMFGWLNKNRIVLYGLLGATVAVAGVLTTHAIITEVLKAKTYALAAAQKILGLAMGTTATAEEGATVASVGLSGAMRTLPIFALIGLIVLAVTHWRQFKQAAVEVWHGITFAARSIVKDVAAAFSMLFDVLTFPFRKAWQFISGVFSKITSIPGKIGHAAGSLLHTATFGLLATGGTVKPKYLASGGPSGTDVVPGWLTPGEGVVNTRGMRSLGDAGLAALNAGRGVGGGEITINPLPVILNLDGRVLTQTVVHFTQMRGARGSSSLVGGGLMTGSA